MSDIPVQHEKSNKKKRWLLLLLLLLLFVVIGLFLLFRTSKISGSKGISTNHTQSYYDSLYALGELPDSAYVKSLMSLFKSGSLSLEDLLSTLTALHRGGSLSIEELQNMLSDLLSDGAINSTQYLDALSQLFSDGAITSDQYIDALQKALSDGDISSAQYLDALSKLLSDGTITSEQYIDALQKALSNGDISSTEYLAALQELLVSGEISVETYLSLLDEGLRSGALSCVEYLKELQKLYDSGTITFATFNTKISLMQRDGVLAQDNCAALKKTLGFIDEVAQQMQISEDSIAKEQLKHAEQLRVSDSLHRIDSLAHSDSVRVADSLQYLDSLAAVAQNRCSQDSTAPIFYPISPSGNYQALVSLDFYRSEPATIFASHKRLGPYMEVVEPLVLRENRTLYLYAVDSCNNTSDTISRVYTIGAKEEMDCPKGMVSVVGSSGSSFCIDQYEWPNKKGAQPTTRVTYAQAQDSCYIVGKRLCSADEWTTACEGPHEWKYPYGNSYEQHICVTKESRSQRSGRSQGCRSWNPVFDMVGNVAEWTSTPARQNNRFYVVKGGFWESATNATCGGERYSYYPNNKHNPVGFRCCQDDGGQ